VRGLTFPVPRTGGLFSRTMFVGVDHPLSELLESLPPDASVRFAASRGVDGTWYFDAHATVGDQSASAVFKTTPGAAVAEVKEALLNKQLANGVRP
jgi:hypothetical protein